MQEEKEYMLTSSAPCKDRKETTEVLAKVCSGFRPSISNVHGEGPLLVSNNPLKDSTDESEGVILGIDEAGRGPVLGPMTYAAAYWYPSESKSIPKGFTDSKQISPAKRSLFFSQIKSNPKIGFVLRVLHASEISRNMLRANPYNLNAMSHRAAMDMIQAVIDAGVKIDTCFIDTVGIADSYRLKLEREFEGHGIKFVVEKKADAKYAPCSAASVVAKVSRDSILESWDWSETSFESVDGKNYGSGYPSDPICKAWLEKNFSDLVFCFPDLVRFSWGPVKQIVNERGIKVQWEAEEDEDDLNSTAHNQTSMNSFLIPTGKRKVGVVGHKRDGGGMQIKKNRFRFFDRKELNAVTKIVEM